MAQGQRRQCKRTAMIAVVRGKGNPQEEKEGAREERSRQMQGTEQMW